MDAGHRIGLPRAGDLLLRHRRRLKRCVVEQKEERSDRSIEPDDPDDAIVDSVKQHEWTALGMNSVALGFRLSFLTCGLLILSGTVVAVTLLPKQPRSEQPPLPDGLDDD